MFVKQFITVAALCAAAGTATNAHAQWLPDYQVYSIQRIGLFGPENTGSAADFFATPGSVAGYSNRRAASSINTNGQNTWQYNSTTNTTVQTGLTSAAHTGSAGYQYSVNNFLNAAGQVAGYSTRFTSVTTDNGRNTWVFNPTINATVQTGFTGAGYTGSAGYQYSFNNFQNAAGYVAGNSDRITGLNTSIGRNTWVYNPTSNSTLQTGFTGATYTGSAGFQIGENNFQNAAGQVAGYSVRIIGVSVSNGANTWVYNPTSNTSVQTGFTGVDYTGSAGLQNSYNDFQNTGGQVAGYSSRYTGVSTDNGRNTWVYNPTTNTTVQSGLTGANYTGSTGYQYSFNNLQNDAGQIAGYSQRISGVNTDNGRNTWVYDPTTNNTVQIGLTGTDYTGSAGYQYSFNNLQNAAGQIAGYSQRISGVNTDNGRNTWVYRPATNVAMQTGLTGMAYTGTAGYQYSENNRQNAAGQVLGYSLRITGVSTANGRNTWVYSPATNTTMQTGLTGVSYTGSAGYQYSENFYQNATGLVSGFSLRITGVSTDNGRNTWFYNPATNTTMQTGLTGAAHTGSAGFQYSYNQFLSSAGPFTGFSQRVTGVNTYNGENTWVYYPATNTTVQTGLTGAAYTGSAGYQQSITVYQNAAGQLAGFSQRYTGVNTPNGQDTWYYDPSTNLTSAIIGSIRTSDNFSSSTPTILTEEGFLLGNYQFFAGGLGSGEMRAFIFRPDLGLTDLGNLVNGGLAANGWSELTGTRFADALRTIVGGGYIDRQTGTSGVFVMTIPAPAATALLGLGGLIASRRRCA